MKTLRLNIWKRICPSGSVQFFNPQLPQDLEVIPPNGITDQDIRVGLGTTVNDSGLLNGQLITKLSLGYW